jgi:poly(3-hydroxybutyrate) depolymerase
VNGAYTSTQQFPLLVILPGLNDDPDHVLTNNFTGLSSWPHDLNVMVLGLKAPTSATNGQDTWNGSTSCCWADAGPPDTTTAIANAIDAMCDSRTPGGTGAWPCDPKRIWIFGHSAGAVQAHRFACDHSDLVSGVVTVTGSALADGFDSACSPAHHVSFLHIHGDADNYLYNNSTGDTVTGMAHEYVSAEVSRATPTRTATTIQESSFNGGCGSLSTTSTGLVYDTAGGATTTTIKDWSACPPAGGEMTPSVELWDMGGSVHIPTFNAAAYTAMVTWLKVQVKP